MARTRRRPPRRWVLGLLLLSVSLLTAFSLTGSGWGSMTGPFGQVWVHFWVSTFGIPGLGLILLVGALWGIALLARLPRRIFWGQLTFVWPFVVLWDAFLQGIDPPELHPTLHGWLASEVHFAVRDFFGADGTMQHGLALGTLALTATILLLRWGLPASVGQAFTQAVSAAARGVSYVFSGFGRGLGRASAGLWQHVLRPAGRGIGAGITHGAKAAWRGLAGLDPFGREEAFETPGLAGSDGPGREGLRSDGPIITTDDEPDADFDFSDFEDVPPPLSAEELAGERNRRPGESTRQGGFFDDLDAQTSAGEGRATRGSPRKKSRIPVPEVPRGAQPIAPLHLLKDHQLGGSEVGEEEIRSNAALLRDTLASFGIAGEVSEVHPGPVITRYEFTPGVGVTISQIVSRQTDLALAMRAPRVRMLAPIPGKAAVGVEIPNRDPALIGFKEVAGKQTFFDTPGALVVALGKDVAARPFYTALEKMPHLLVAGTTGSGKSVCMNTLIVSLLLQNSPDQLRLLLIDPKMLEFTGYNDIPHLLQPVVTEAREAAKALRWLTREMEKRYRVLAGVGVRNIQGYHERQKQPGAAEELAKPMPYIVVMVDELADLMLSNASEVEVPIARLAQMARAVGIHLVLATQRPSVDVITGVIKANFPARIAFQVATRTDSRTILDMNGAESLLGRGDMLFIPPGKAEAHRIHGAFISDEETEQIVAYLQQFPTPESLIQVEQDGGIEGEGDDQEDSLYPEALKIVVASGQGSTSMLQRRLRVGYTRAGRLMDMLERAGVVGPPDGSRAREVLVKPDRLEELLAAETSAPR